MRLPFIREISPQIEKEINAFCAKLDFETKLLLISDTYSLQHVLKHKEQQQILHQYGVVYEISCNCGSFYVGQTSRNLITCINNHNLLLKHHRIRTSHGIWPITLITQFVSITPSSWLDLTNDHWRKLLIKETLMIQQRNLDLNSDKASILLYLFNVWKTENIRSTCGNIYSTCENNNCF